MKTDEQKFRQFCRLMNNLQERAKDRGQWDYSTHNFAMPCLLDRIRWAMEAA